MRYCALFAIALAVSPMASVAKDTTLTHDADLIDAVKGVAQSCVKYALRRLGAAHAGHDALALGETSERRKAWGDIAYTRYFEECVAEAARELAETAHFDLEEKKDDLQKLNPLYSFGGPPAHIDATATLVSATTIRYGETTMPLRDFLSMIWKKQWKDVVVRDADSSSGMWCLLHLGYISGARIHISESDGSWSKATLNVGTGEKGIALTINQCLSGDSLEESP